MGETNLQLFNELLIKDYRRMESDLRVEKTCNEIYRKYYLKVDEDGNLEDPNGRVKSINGKVIA